MSETIIRDNHFLFSSFLLGVMVTCFYDGFRILRRLFKHGDRLVSLEDLFFWLVVAFQVFVLMQEENNGNLRWFAVLGALTGMLLYKKIISNWFVDKSSKLLDIVLQRFKKVVKWLIRPVLLGFKKILKAIRYSKKLGGRKWYYVKKRLNKWKKTLRMVLQR